jgi:hypothetical protein
VNGCPADNMLNSNLPSIWLTEEGLPQWVCISLQHMKEPDGEAVVVRSVGWHCWHQYTTNPRVVTVHVSTDGKKFKLWDTFTAGTLPAHDADADANYVVLMMIAFVRV